MSRATSRSALAAGAAAALIAGLSLAAAAEVTLIHYNYTGHGKQHADFVKQRADAFMKLHPDIKIEIINNGNNNYWDKLATLEAGGVSPDLLELYPSSAPPFLEAHMVMDLTPLIKSDPDVDLNRWADVANQGFNWKGTIWGLPTSTYQILNFYNVDMYRAAGLATPNELGDRWTWQALIDAGKKMTRDTNGDGKVDTWGVRAYNDLFRWWTFVHQAGGGLFDKVKDPDQATFTSDAAQTGLQFVVDLFNRDKIATTDINAFYQGKVANDIVDGPSLFGVLPAQVGNAFHWDIAQLPKGPDNNGTMVFLNGFEIGAGTTHPKEAWEWLKFLVGEDSMRDYARITGRTPALKSLLPQYGQLLQQAPEHLQAAGDAILNPNSTIPYLTDAANDIRSMANKLVSSQVLTGKLAVKPALEQINAFANQKLKEAKAKA
ncbi:MAG TPA: extracellular solute-binding protein [Limnochordia bacterium]|nr:extracellular solute-binding protein [Limnochordia bacterium]